VRVVITFRVLGPLAAEDARGAVDLRGPRHRAVLARLLVARGRVVPVDRLVDDLWTDPPEGAVGAVQTFVAALRKALEPTRPPRTPARVLVTVAPGYALRATSVDAHEFEKAVTGAATLPPAEALPHLDEALSLWRGPAYAEFAEEPWARGEATRLDELRLLATERRSAALLELGRAEEAAADLQAHTEAHPWREEAWRLLAVAQYRTARQGDALETLRRARRTLATDLGLDPGPALRRLEADILAQAPTLTPATTGQHPRTAAAGGGSGGGGAGEGSPARQPGGGLGERGTPTEAALPAGAGPTVVSGEPDGGAGGGAVAAGRVAGRAGPAAVSGVAEGPGEGAGGGELAAGEVAGRAEPTAVSGVGGEPGGGAVAAGHLAGRAGPAAVSGVGDEPGGGAGGGEVAADPVTGRAGPPPAGAGGPDGAFVGRDAELGQLLRAAESVRARGRLGLVLLAGEAGAGKTALAGVFSRRLAARGWSTAWGSNPDDDGLPAAWAWTTVLAALPGVAPRPDDGSGDAAMARFRWHRAVGEYLGRHAPLLVVLDDLHWAGEEGLALLASLVAEPVPRPVVVLATYRTTDVPPRLGGLLGRVARAEPFRVYLGGLSREAVGELAVAVSGRRVDAGTAAVLHQRSGGNPFFVRELARLLDGGLDAVPAGVRDVVRYRLATLPAPVQEVLRKASVLSGEVDLEVLDELDALETAVEKGFLVEVGAGRFRFVHALVRDTLYQDLSRSRRARWHAELAAVIEHRRPEDVEALAHHHLHAGTDPDAVVRYARAAAERAEHRFALHEAARLWRAALDHAGHDRDDRLDLVVGLGRTLALTGRLAEARRLRADALVTGGDPVRTAQVLTAFDVPALWTDHDDPGLARRVADVAEHTLAALPPHETALRSRLLSTIALELRTAGGDRARAAAHEAAALARDLDDPAVLAFALNARFMQSFDRPGRAPDRLRIGTELVALAARHGLVTFEVLGHLVLVQAHAALADLTAGDRHAAAADRLGTDHGIPLVTVFTGWYRALRATVRGEPAEAAYRAAASGLPDSGMTGMDDGLLGLALLCDRVHRGEPPRDADFGAHEPWCRPLVLLAEGRTADARAAVVPPAPHDLLYEARTCLHALVAVAVGDRRAMARLYADLLPAADELAGAGSGLLTLRPVAHYLGALAAALGRPADAAAHHRHARAVSARAGKPAPESG
jgi:DNA-binding SARP family transcriptional activator